MAELFKGINFSTYTSDMRLSEKRAFVNQGQTPDYNPNAVKNTNFSIAGSVDAFVRPPISQYALENLYYMQDFDIFHYDFDSFTERENFDSFLLSYTYGGKGKLSYNNKVYELSPGDCFFIDCRKHHKYEVVGNAWDTGILHIQGQKLKDFYAMFASIGEPVFCDSPSGEIQRTIEQLLLTYQVPQIYRDWQASGFIVQLLNHIIMATSKKNALKETPDNIQYLLKYIESNYNKPLTLDYLARFSNMSKYHLSREFKKYTGFSPNEYIISLRIDHAKTLIKNSNLSIYEIAQSVGIYDINNFTNLFKKRVGITPTLYRKTN